MRRCLRTPQESKARVIVETGDSAAATALIRALGGDVEGTRSNGGLLGAIVNAGLFTPSTGNERFNLLVDAVIDVQDLNAVVPFLFLSCQPAP